MIVSRFCSRLGVNLWRTPGPRPSVSLPDPMLPVRTTRIRRSPEPHSRLRTSYIGTAGFEPATPATPLQCATGLRHVPKHGKLNASRRVGKRSVLLSLETLHHVEEDVVLPSDAKTRSSAVRRFMSGPKRRATGFMMSTMEPSHPAPGRTCSNSRMLPSGLSALCSSLSPSTGSRTE